MTVRTGLKSIIAISALGIGIAVFLMLTCPFAGQLAFSAQVRQTSAQHAVPTEGHGAREDAHEPKSGSMSEPHDEHHGFSVHLMMVPGVRKLPVKETKVAGFEVSALGIVILLLVIALCIGILQRRSWNLFGVPVTPQAMGAMVFLITLGNLMFAVFLLGVEVIQFREL